MGLAAIVCLNAEWNEREVAAWSLNSTLTWKIGRQSDSKPKTMVTLMSG